MGSSRCALQSPIFQSHFPFPASSSSSTSSRPSRAGGYSPKRAGRWKVSAMKAEDARDIGGSRRRALVLVGLSAIRFLQLPAMAIVDDLEKGSDSGEIAETNPKAPDGGFSPISVLSPFGIVGSGVLGALYAISQKEKAEMELSIASMNTTLSEKEARNVSLEVNFRRRLEKQQEEHRNQVGKLKEEEELLNRELTSAKATVSAIGLELKSEKQLAEDLKSQIEKLQSSLNRSLGERRALEATLKEREDSIIGLDNKVNSLVLEIENKEAALLTLRSNLSDRESEIGELTSAAEKTRSELEETVSALTQLRIDHLAVNGELELKKSEIDDLKKRIESVIGERDEAIEKNRTLQAELAQLKTSFEEKSASDFELLTKKEEEVRRLEENLATALSQSTSSWELIAEMTLERENLRVKLEEESKNLNAMKEEFLLAQQNLEDQKQAVSDLSEQLQKNEKVNAELNFEISMVKKESLEAETLLKISLEEERATVGSLADELDSIKGALTKAQEELAATTEELKAALKTRDELKDELAVSEEKATFITQELERERNTVATLNSQLEESTRKRDELYREKVETEKNLDEAMTSLVQVNERVLALTVLNSKLEESAQKTYELSKEKVEIEKSLEEALASLAEVNERVLALTNELEEGKSVNGALQAEKDMIFQSLAEHRETAREAQENIEDAQKVITYLGEERERLEKKVKKFEEELAASKGEILRLRRQASLQRETATQQTAKSPENEPVGEASVSKRSVASRRKKASARVSRPES